MTCLAVLIKHRRVTDGQVDGRTDRQADDLRQHRPHGAVKSVKITCYARCYVFCFAVLNSQGQFVHQKAQVTFLLHSY